jgi:UDP-N-acetylmuramyl pentapeptide synthase
MQETPVQILEVRADEQAGSVAITAAVTADASRAIFVALTEQLDRDRGQPAERVEDVLVLREGQSLVERFAPLAAAGAHAVVRFSESELRACLLNLTDYTERVDGEHFQPVELRERLQAIAQITAVLWDANAAAAAAAAASAGPLTRAAQ